MYSEFNRDPKLLTMGHMSHYGGPITNPVPVSAAIPHHRIPQPMPMMRTDVAPVGGASMTSIDHMGMRRSPPYPQDLTNVDNSSTSSSGSSSSSSGAAGAKQRKGKCGKRIVVIHTYNQNTFSKRV